jgi:hypothetical protein
MGRSDVGRLKLPENQAETKPELEKPDEVHAQVEATEPPKVVPKPNLDVCPHCGARLSSLDLKMNQCFRCWARLDADGSANPPLGRTSFEVHI